MFGWRKGSPGGGGLGRKVRHEPGHEWNGWIMEGVSARVGLLGWGRGLGTGAHRGGGGLPFRPCFGPHSASPTTSPGLRRPAPAPPGPATPLRRPRASLTEAAQVLLSFETGRGSVPALQPAGKRRPKRTSAATATATAAATVTSSSRSSDSRVAAALRKNRPPLPHCTACLAVT